MFFSTIIPILAIVFIILGTGFTLVGAIGLYRMKDIFIRMSSATKTTILGTGFLLIGVSLFFWDLGVAARAAAIFVFTLATAPISAHMIGRAAYSDGVELWGETLVDELRDKYDEKNQVLSSGEFAKPESADDWRTEMVDDHGV